jgi:hypothetical protein
MKIVNPNYQGATPASITPARWAAILAAAQTFINSHPEIAYFDVAQVQALVPELADATVFQQFLRALNLSVVG